jgi:hypothetical protein
MAITITQTGNMEVILLIAVSILIYFFLIKNKVRLYRLIGVFAFILVGLSVGVFIQSGVGLLIGS